MFNTMAFKYIATFLVSMTPVLELRGAIPLGVLLGLTYFQVFLISVIGNILPIYFIVKYAGPIFDFFGKLKPLKKLLDKITEKTTKKIEKSEKLQNYTAFGLFVFVAIPLPGTGAWTGALIANFLHLPVKKSFLPIAFGVLGAGIIMLTATAITKGGIQVIFN